MGIWERPPAHFLDALQAEFGFEPPREHGYDAVAATTALLEGRAKVFLAMGGNFVSAMSDTLVVEKAMRGAALTVHVSTKLNRSHVSHGREALILPALGRSERDLTGGHEQRITVEDSMSAVHASRGPLRPASDWLKSEVDIVCSLAEATLAGRQDATGSLPWSDFRSDYGQIRGVGEFTAPHLAKIALRRETSADRLLRSSRVDASRRGLTLFLRAPRDELAWVPFEMRRTPAAAARRLAQRVRYTCRL